LPGAAALLGGLILLASTHRAVAVWASWLAAVGGAWFVVGPSLSRLWTHGAPQAGTPTATSTLGTTVQEIGFFYGVGVVILFLSAVALGRVSMVGVRDAQAATARAAADQPTTFQPPVYERGVGERGVNERGAEETTRVESPRHATERTEENPPA